jgi:hypothetical protein
VINAIRIIDTDNGHAEQYYCRERSAHTTPTSAGIGPEIFKLIAPEQRLQSLQAASLDDALRERTDPVQARNSLCERLSRC